jgi:hypothetical protein
LEKWITVPKEKIAKHRSDELPAALTRQHDYLTTNIYVYNAQAIGEIGGTLDMFFKCTEVQVLVENLAPSSH